MQATETLLRSDKLKAKIKKVIEDSDFRIWIHACLENMGPYKKAVDFSDIPHIQMMKNGGKDAVELFIHNLVTLPYKEAGQEQEKLEFVPPSELSNML